MSRALGQSKNMYALSFPERCIACLIVCVLLITGLGAPSQVAQARPYPGESARDTSWYNSGQSSFTLSTPEELAGLAYLVSEERQTFEGKTVSLANDIDLSGICSGGVDWLPIGWGYSGGTPFMGTFDGGDHTVSGLKIDDSGYYNALFGSIRKATIKNLTVQGEVYGSEDVAGIVSQCSDSDLINLTNECYVDAIKYNKGAGEGRAAGVVCYVATAYPTASRTFEKLVNKGDVRSSSYYTGGVAGFLYCADGYSISVVNCANYGNVDVSTNVRWPDDANRSVGGVIGSTAGNYGTYVLSGCVNEGMVSSENLAATGGIAGYLGGNGSSITYSSNTGYVSGPNRAGGIVGYFGSSGGVLQSLLNTGSISGSGSRGGIAGGSSNAGQAFALNYTYDDAMGEAYGSGVGADGSDAAVDADELRTQDFLDLINNGDDQFAILEDENNGFPILAWTNPAAIPGKGGLVNQPPVDPELDDAAKEEEEARKAEEERAEAEKAAEEARQAEEAARQAEEEAAEKAKEAEEEAKRKEEEAAKAADEAKKAAEEAEAVDDSDKEAKEEAEKKAKAAAKAAEEARKKADAAAGNAKSAKEEAEKKATESNDAAEAAKRAKEALKEAEKKAAEAAKRAKEAKEKAEKKAQEEREKAKNTKTPRRDTANQTLAGRQNGSGSGLASEDPAHYTTPNPLDSAPIPSAIAPFNDPVATSDASAKNEDGAEPAPPALTDTHEPPPDGPAPFGAQGNSNSAPEASQTESAAGSDAAEVATESQAPAASGEMPEGNMLEEAQAFPAAASSADGPVTAEGGVVRQMVEIAAVPQEQEIGGDARPDLMVIGLALMVLFLVVGVAYENVAFTRRGGGWGKAASLPRASVSAR